jgi:hypothetical protein
MKRYTIVFHSHSTGTAVPVNQSDTPKDALKIALDPQTQRLRDVRIVDTTTQEALDPKAFAKKHSL